MDERLCTQTAEHHRPRVLFLGRKNSFNIGIMDWLAENFDLVGVFLVEPDRFSCQARWCRIRKRAQKHGWFQALNEFAFQIWYWLCDRRLNEQHIANHLPERFHQMRDCPYAHWNVSNPHAPEWIEKLKELNPDFVFVVCCSVILKKEFYSVPKFGAFVLHEGMTPEYRGLHTPLWALAEKNPDGIGYSLIQIADSIDGGPILVQGQVSVRALNQRLWSFIGHAALVEGLPSMAQALKLLTRTGKYKPVSITGRKNRYVTWMPLSTYVRSFMLGRLPRHSRPPGPTSNVRTLSTG